MLSATAGPGAPREGERSARHLIAVVGVATLALAACSGSGSGGSSSGAATLTPLPSVSAPAGPSAVSLPTTSGGARVVGRYRYRGATSSDGRHLYVSDEATGRLMRIDPRTGRATPIAVLGKSVYQLTANSGVVWASRPGADGGGDRPVSAVGLPDGRMTWTVRVPNSFAVIQVGSAAWALDDNDDSIDRIDPRTGAVRHKVRTGSLPYAVIEAYGALWVADHHSDAVDRVDPIRARADTIAAGSGPGRLASGGGAVWVANWDDNTISRIDPRSMTVRTFAVLPASGVPGDIAYLAGSVWVVDTHAGAVVRVDPRSGRPVAAVRLGSMPDGASMTAVGGRLWVSISRKGTYEIDPDRG